MIRKRSYYWVMPHHHQPIKYYHPICTAHDSNEREVEFDPITNVMPRRVRRWGLKYTTRSRCTLHSSSAPLPFMADVLTALSTPPWAMMRMLRSSRGGSSPRSSASLSDDMNMSSPPKPKRGKRARAEVAALLAAFTAPRPPPPTPPLPLCDAWREQAQWETSVQAPLLYDRHDPPP